MQGQETRNCPHYDLPINGGSSKRAVREAVRVLHSCVSQGTPMGAQRAKSYVRRSNAPELQQARKKSVLHFALTETGSEEKVTWGQSKPPEVTAV